jgi:hypothetical protein
VGRGLCFKEEMAFGAALLVTGMVQRHKAFEDKYKSRIM